jgi:hypothetical protein
MSLIEDADVICPIFILDNSDKTPFESDANPFVRVIDNTNYKHTPNFNQPSKNHCSSIEYALYNVIKTKYVLLVDNDIIFYPNLPTILNARANYQLIGEIGYDIVPGNRLFPYMCLIDLEWVKMNNIHYFDAARCITDLKTMDTGASFLEDCLPYKPAIWQIKLTDYILHLKGGTLHNKSIP